VKRRLMKVERSFEMKVIMTTIVALVLATTSAASQTGAITLQDSSGNKVVAVWRSDKAMEQGRQLVQQGISKQKPELLLQLIACFVPNGTKASFTNTSFFSVSTEVLIVDGERAGCRGVVSANDIEEVQKK
jgi:hypothetical protein